MIGLKEMIGIIESVMDAVALFPFTCAAVALFTAATSFISVPSLVIYYLWIAQDKHEIDLNARSLGLPIVGETCSWRRRPDFFTKRFEKYGELFCTRLSYPAIPLLI